MAKPIGMVSGVLSEVTDLELVQSIGTLGVGGKVFSSTTPSSAIANTTTETDFSLSFTVPANSLAVGKVLRLLCRGTLNTHTTAPTLFLKVKLGGVQLAVTPTWTTVASTANRGWELTFDVVVVSVGAAGTLECQGSFSAATGAASAVTSVLLDLKNTAAVTVNTTQANVLAVAAKWSAANNNNSIIMRQMIVEVLND